MNKLKPSLFPRIFLAFPVFFRFVFNQEFAAHVLAARSGETAAGEKARPAPAAPLTFREAPADAALQLLGLLQQEGRFVDFLQEDLTSFSDSEIGAAARVVHEGCRKVVGDHFKIVPVRDEPEGSRITLEAGFDASAVRLTGNVVGKAPFSGSLIHRGWRAVEVKLPKVAEGHDTRVLAAAEVEL